MLDRAINQYGNRLIVIRYHWYYPDATDPYYVYNTPENNGRQSYYGGNYTPHSFVDGNLDADADTSLIKTRIASEMNVSSPITINLSGEFNSTRRAGYISAQIIAVDSIANTNLKVRVVVMESNINRSAPNGVNIHNQTFRDMIPGLSGASLTIHQPDTVVVNQPISCPSPEVLANTEVVVFVQSDTGHRILQAAKISINSLTQTGVDDNASVPNALSLAQNYPNPFNSETRIDFSTPGGNTSVEIYDITGARVTNLINKNLTAGFYSLVWDGRDQTGKQVASGTYFYRLTDASGSQTMRMTLLK
ncbi:MAG TPA: hypothetical protein DCZ43_06065 [candidate division Zixibacteria bacterium]|nr:hypothetical protein [candidate division Zixibacteria bacterium]